MTALEKQLNELMQSLHELTDCIFQSIENEQWDKINEKMRQRHECISELMSFCTLETRDTLIEFFNIIRECDAKIMQLLSQHAEKIKLHLLQLDKTRKYVHL